MYVCIYVYVGLVRTRIDMYVGLHRYVRTQVGYICMYVHMCM